MENKKRRGFKTLINKKINHKRVCISIKKNRKDLKIMCSIPYKVYEKKSLLNGSINKRGKELIYTLFFEINHLSFAVIYQPHYSKSTNLSHFAFHALSRGFEAFTSTGYHSIFVNSAKGVASYGEIKRYLFKKIGEKIDLEKVSTKPIQLNLFEM